MIPWGPFRPDAAGPNSGFAVQANNVLPKMSGGQIAYGPFPALATATGAEALPAAPLGGISLVKNDGTYSVFFATATTIEEMDSSFQFSSIATGLSVTAGDDMSFCHFGNFLLNSNTTDGFNAYNVETPAGNNSVSGAPSARFIFSANNVVIALDCDGNNRRMKTSGIGDHTAWTSKGADGKTFEDGGALICGADMQNGAAVLFQSQAMRLMQFGGAPGGALYRVSKIADGKGSVGERSVVAFDGVVYFLATDGFYRYALGGRPEPIGAEKIDRWFLDRVDTEDLAKVQGSIDPLNKLIMWRFKANDVSSSTVFEDAICYDWQLKEWFTVTQNTSALARIATPGYTVDGPYAAVIVDDNNTLVDDRFYQGGQPVFAALDEDFKFATFSGAALAATLESSPLNNPVSGLLTRVTPIDDADSGTLAVGYADSTGDALTFAAGAARQTSGSTSQRVRGLNLAFRRNIDAGDVWTNAVGVDHLNRSRGGIR